MGNAFKTPDIPDFGPTIGVSKHELRYRLLLALAFLSLFGPMFYAVMKPTLLKGDLVQTEPIQGPFAVESSGMPGAAQSQFRAGDKLAYIRPICVNSTEPGYWERTIYKDDIAIRSLITSPWIGGEPRCVHKKPLTITIPADLTPGDYVIGFTLILGSNEDKPVLRRTLQSLKFEVIR